MSGFKPQNTGSNSTRNFDNTKYPTPQAGTVDARIALIVDLGTQAREDFEDTTTGALKPQKPCQQVAIFADLVDDIVDYGAVIGEQPYRLCLNKTFGGKLEGVNFTPVPSKDGNGKIIQGKIWTFTGTSLLSKLAKATGHEEILGGNEKDNMDISLLLGEPLMINVEVKETDSGKTNDKGEPIIYTNVSAKGYTPIPIKKGKKLEVEELRCTPKCVTFDNATVEDVKILRPMVITKIKAALNFEGSQMEKAIKEYELSKGESAPPAEKPKASTTSKTATKKPVVEVDEDDDIDNLPF